MTIPRHKTQLRKQSSLPQNTSNPDRDTRLDQTPRDDWDISTSDLAKQRPSYEYRQQISQRNIAIAASSGISLTASALHSLVAAQEEPPEQMVFADLTRNFMHVSSLKFKDALMEHEYLAQKNHASPYNVGILFCAGAALYIVNICQPAFFLDTSAIARESALGAASLIVVVGITAAQFCCKVRPYLTGVLFLGLSCIIAGRHSLTTLSIYQTALFQLAIIIAQSFLAANLYQTTLLTNIGVLVIFIIEASIKSTSAIEPITGAIILFSSIVLIAATGYQQERYCRTTFLVEHPVYILAQSRGMQRATKLGEFETPLEKAINIIKAVLEETRVNVIQEKCLLTALDFLAKGDLLLPEFIPNLVVDTDQQVTPFLYKID